MPEIAITAPLESVQAGFGLAFDKNAVLAEIPKVELADDARRGRSAGWVYFISCPVTDRCKIGFTKGHPKKRLASLQIGSPSQLVLRAMHPGTVNSERTLHDRFASYRIHGEWFSTTNSIRAYIDVTLWRLVGELLEMGTPLEKWMIVAIEKSLKEIGTHNEKVAKIFAERKV